MRPPPRAYASRPGGQLCVAGPGRISPHHPDGITIPTASTSSSPFQPEIRWTCRESRRWLISWCAHRNHHGDGPVPSGDSDDVGLRRLGLLDDRQVEGTNFINIDRTHERELTMSDPPATRTILRVDSGADHPGSVSRKLADELLVRLCRDGDRVVRRDASVNLPFVSAEWVGAAFAGADPAALALSDELVDELLSAEELVLVAPVYNFGIPAAMKAWVDQVCRAGRTFRFTETGPEGLVGAKRAWIVSASGGTVIGGPADFNTGYLRAVLGFLGVQDVRVIAAEQLQLAGEAAITKAYEDLHRLVG